jgi:hypothetical protein
MTRPRLLMMMLSPLVAPLLLAVPEAVEVSCCGRAGPELDCQKQLDACLL